MSPRRVVPRRRKRLEVTGNAILVALTLSRLVLLLTGRSSLALSTISLLIVIGALLYYLRLRPRQAKKWPVASGSVASTTSASPPPRFVRYLAGTFASVIAGAAGFTALGLDRPEVGIALLILSTATMALVWRLRWPFE